MMVVPVLCQPSHNSPLLNGSQAPFLRMLAPRFVSGPELARAATLSAALISGNAWANRDRCPDVDKIPF